MKKFTFIVILILFSYLNAKSQWDSVLNPFDSNVYGSSIAVDNQGNIYSVGSVFKNSTEKDNYYLVKYNSTGDTLWTRSYNRSNESDQSVKILIDADNNILVTGTSYTATNAEDIVTLKYNPNGDLLNTNIYDGTNHLADKARDIITDTDGNYYLCGMSTLTSQRAYVLAKTNNNLEKIWAKVFTSYYGANPMSISYNATKQQIAITGSYTDYDNLYLMGTIVYDTSGTKIWEDDYRTIADRSAVGFDVSLNDDGTTYVCGYESNAGTNKWEAILIKYDTNGDTLWTRKVSAGDDPYSVYKSIAQDNAGNIYTTGSKGNTSITAKYSQDGNRLWLNEHAAKGDFSTVDTRESIKMDNNGDLIVLTRDYAASGGGTMLLKYDSEGDQLWTKHYNGSASQVDEPLTFDIDASDNCYVLINSRNSDYYFDMATVQFTPEATTTSILDPIDISTQILYPNPSKGVVNILRSDESKITIKVYSEAGILLDEIELQPYESYLDLSNLTNGFYFLELDNTAKKVVSKLIIQK